MYALPNVNWDIHLGFWGRSRWLRLAMSPLLSSSLVTVPCLMLRSLDAHTTTQRGDNMSSSLSLITFTMWLSVQVPITSRTRLEKSEPLGTIRKMKSSLYPLISLAWTLRMTNPNGRVWLPPNPTKCSRWSTRFSSGNTGHPF